MRTRNNSNSIVIPESSFERFNSDMVSLGVFGQTSSRELVVLEEVMEDDTSKPYGQFKDCSHSTFVVRPNSGIPLYRPIGAFYGHHDLHKEGWMLAQADLLGRHLVGVNSVANKLPENWESHSGEAWQAMNPSNDSTDLQLVNDLLELKELGRLVTGFWASRYDLIRKTTNAHLNYSFGWRPLLASVQGVYHALVDLHKKYETLVKNAGRRLTRHHSRPLGSGSFGETGNFSLSGILANREYKYNRAVYHATVRYSYTIPDEGRYLSNDCKYALDILGFKPDPSIAWNAIRYSFVLDWVTNVGRWLQSLSLHNLDLSVKIHGFCHSIKADATAKLSAVEPEFGFPIVTEYASYYQRRAANIGGVALVTRLPSWNALLLGGSLLEQSRDALVTYRDGSTVRPKSVVDNLRKPTRPKTNILNLDSILHHSAWFPRLKRPKRRV